MISAEADGSGDEQGDKKYEAKKPAQQSTYVTILGCSLWSFANGRVEPMVRS